MGREERKILEKAKKYLREHGFLKQKCRVCGIEFICSGHCLEDYSLEVVEEQSYDSLTLRRKSCLCSKCDFSKYTSPEWFKNCQKDFPFSWIILKQKEAKISNKKNQEKRK